MSRTVKVGARVVTGGKTGVVRFFGTTEFSVGEWVGVELDKPEGKNNGSVNGVEYFQCKEKYGLFVKKSQVRAAPGSSASGGGAAAGGSPAPAKTGRRGTVSARGTPKTPKPSSSASNIPTRTSRLSGSSSAPSAAPEPAPAPARSPSKSSRNSAPASESVADAAATEKRSVDGPGGGETSSIGAPRGRSGSSADAQSVATIMRLTEQLEEKESVVQQMEYKEYQLMQKAKTAEEQVKELQARVLEKEKLLAAATSKADSLERRHADTSGDMKDKLAQSAKDKAALVSLKRKFDDAELKIAELEESVEMLTLEKEEVELRAEEFEEKAAEQELELESLYEKIEHLETTQQVRQAATASDGGGDGDGSSQAADADVSQLIDHNAKLRAALQKLHDQSNAQKTELSKQLRMAEKQAAKVPDLEDKVQDLQTKNAELTEAVSDLKDQLDTASAFEEMVEDLSEKNLELGDKVAELETAVAEFEDERELNEELELERDETEKQLNEEVSVLTTQVTKLTQAVGAFKSAVNDRELTIGKYREQLAKAADEMDGLKEQISYLRQAEGASSATLQNALSSQNSLAAVQRRAAQASLDLRMEQFKLGLKSQEVDHLSAFIPSELLQSDAPALAVLRSIAVTQDKFAFIVNKISDRALNEQQVKDIYGEVSLREFARECAGAAQIGIVVRAVATVDIVLNHVDTPEDVFLESASLAEVPVGSAGRAADTILAAMRINGGNGVYAESLTELCELAPAAQSAADKCLALIASQSNENDADSTNANGSGGEVDPFSLLAGHEDLLCAAQEAAYLSAALLAKLRLCASEFDNQPEPSEQDRSRVTDLKREFKSLGEALLEDVWKPCCRALARLEQNVVEARASHAATRLTDNGAMTLQMLRSCCDLVRCLNTKADGLLGGEGLIAAGLSGDSGTSLKAVEDAVKSVDFSGDGGNHTGDCLDKLLAQLKLKVSMAESQVSGGDGAAAVASTTSADSLWKTRPSLPGITPSGAAAGDVSALLSSRSRDGALTPWEKRAAATRAQLVESALLPARVQDLKAEIERGRAALEEKQELVLKAEYLRTKLETRLQAEISRVAGQAEAAQSQLAEAQRENESAIAKERKQLDLAKAKIKRLDEKYKTVMKEMRALKRAGGGTATSPSNSPADSPVAGGTAGQGSPTKLTRLNLKKLAAVAANATASASSSADAGANRSQGAGAAGLATGVLNSAEAVALSATIDYTLDRRNAWKRIALRQLESTLPDLPRVIPAAAASRNAVLHPGVPDFAENQAKIRAQLAQLNDSLVAHISRPTVARIPTLSRRAAAAKPVAVSEKQASDGQKPPSPTTVVVSQPLVSAIDHVASKAARTQQLKSRLQHIRDSVSQKLLRQHQTLRVPTSFSELAFTRVLNSGNGLDNLHGARQEDEHEQQTSDGRLGSLVGKVHVFGAASDGSNCVRIQVRQDGLVQLHDKLLHSGQRA